MVLVHMPVLMICQLLLPWKASQVKTVLFRSKLKLAAERGQANIAIGNGGLILKDDIDLTLMPARSGQCGPAQCMNNRGYLLCLGF